MKSTFKQKSKNMNEVCKPKFVPDAEELGVVQVLLQLEEVLWGFQIEKLVAFFLMFGTIPNLDLIKPNINRDIIML